MGDVVLKQAGILTPSNMDEAFEFAKVMASSQMCPKNFQGKPADIVVAVQWASEVGLAPFAALQSMAVINGKPSLYGDGLLALITGHPEYHHLEEKLEGDVATCTIIRKRPNGHLIPTVRTFSMKDAERAGLTRKGPWQQYPKRMLQMRARGFAARDSFPDALSGIVIKEEAMDYPTGEPEIKDITPKPGDNPLDAAFGGDVKGIDPPGSPEIDESEDQIPVAPKKTDASESASVGDIHDDTPRAWEMATEEGTKEFATVDEWIAAMKLAWKAIEHDHGMTFKDRRHEIGEHKNYHDDIIGRLKKEYKDLAGTFGQHYRRVLKRLSAKAEEAGE